MAESGLSENIFYAAVVGDIDHIKNWLEQGGDPNQGLAQVFHDDAVCWESGSTLLIAATSMGRLDLRLLVVDHNADVNVTAGWTALMWAIEIRIANAVEFLLDRGANTSGIVDGMCGDVALALVATPRVVRILLNAGVPLTIARISRVTHPPNFPGTVTVSLEEQARNCVRFTERNRANYEAYGSLDAWTDTINRYTESAEILEGVRLAGHSYKHWVLKDYMALLRLRSMLARKRARAGPETTLVVWRLFDTSTAAGVPDPVFRKVVEYAWLGDWRHP